MFSRFGINRKLDMVLNAKADAMASIKGSKAYAKIRGSVLFHQTPEGVLVTAYIKGLPHDDNICKSRVFGFHIHEGGKCTGDEDDPFASAGPHYNPKGCPHPHHAGDLPPLFENQGKAFFVFLTNRFKVKEIIGRTIILHGSPDDFTTQPSGNSGEKIACAVIKSL